MTEPVAYLAKSRTTDTVVATTRKYPSDIFENTPLYTAEQIQPRVKMTKAEFDELEISLINAQFDYSELKKTIEIVPDMKWFVRSKEQYQPDMDQGISESGYLYLMQGNFYKIDYHLPTPFKDDAQQFDTKEEAEEYTNPLTEAVPLPVEEK